VLLKRERVTGEIEKSAFYPNRTEVMLVIEDNIRINKQKVGLLILAEELGNVSRAC
jgi:hypothetical protein